MALADRIKQLASDYQEEVVSYRRHIHAHPELAFEENKTSEFVAQKLTQFGVQFKSGIAKTGIIGIIEGKDPGTRTNALRADMDALPITEENDLPFKSTNEGVMHACGHDVHTASLLGTIKILSGLTDQFTGTIKFIFQPSEEKLPGGASFIIKEGGLKNPDAASILGQHVMPDIEVGKVGFRSGMYMASADEIYVTVKGKGGHAAMPQRNIDPVLITSHMIVALQQVVSRNAHPVTPTVLSFGKVIADGATNIIPDEVRIEGTFRTMNEEWREKAHGLMKGMAEQIAQSMGGECDFNIMKGYPCLVNDHDLSDQSKVHAEEYLGKENVLDLDIWMASEDFAFYTQEIPGCFYRLGVRNEAKGITSTVHTPTFDVDEKALEIGSGLMAFLAIQSLQ